MDRLGCLPPSLEPRATQHVDDMLRLTEKVLENGHGYVTSSGDVYCTSHTVPGYGKLSRRGVATEEDG